jgi:drug/metabolite transporter (DMT)-like permease
MSVLQSAARRPPPPPRATLDQVYSLDLAGVSEKLDVSEDEFLAGVARSSEPRTLGQLLEPVAASADGSASAEARRLRRRQLYRDVCLIVPPSTLQTSGRKTLAENGDKTTATLEALLQSMTRPRIMDHLVVCVPAQAPHHVAAAVHRAVDRVCGPLGVHVEVLAAPTEADALFNACKYLHRSPSRWSGDDSDGFLLVRADRVFDAATFEMMMTAPFDHDDSEQSGRESLGQHQRSAAKVATALVSFDVSGGETHEVNGEDTPESAGLFALSRACLGELEQLFAVENHAWCRSIEDALAYWATSEALVVKSVIASDYCNWKTADQGTGTVDNRRGRSRRHQRRPSLGESLHNGVGYSGFQIACTTVSDPVWDGDSVAVSVDRGSDPAKNDMTRFGSPTEKPSDANPLLSSKGETCSYSECDNQSLDLNTGDEDDDNEVSAVSTPELEAVLGPHEQAFLIQTSSASASHTDGKQRIAMTHGSPRHCELILAVPDRKLAIATSTKTSSGLVSLSDLSRRAGEFLSDGSHANYNLHEQGSSLRLPSAVREITVEASVRSPLMPQKYSDDGTTITALTSPQSSMTAFSAAAAASPSATTTTLQVLVKKQVPLIGYLILLTSDLAVASQGAALTMLTDVPPLLKLFWRVSGASMAFLPLAIASVYRNGFPRLGPRKIWMLLLSAIAHTWFNASFLVALNLTSIGHVYIFNNSHSLLLVLFKLLLRQPLSMQELLGAAVGFTGGAITALDHHNGMAHGNVEHHITDWTTTLHGDLLAFAGAFGGVAYLVTAKKLRACMDLPVYLCILMALEALILLVVLVGFRRELGVELTPVSSHAGLVGWIWHHPFSEVYMVIVGSLIGTMGFVAAMKYFDPLVVSLGMLTEPVVATIIGVFAGVASVPGIPTFVGGAGVLAGCLLVILASHRTETRVDVSDAVAIAVKRPAGDDRRSRRHSVDFMGRRPGSGDGDCSTIAGANSSVDYGYGISSDASGGSARLQPAVAFRANYGSFP